VTVRISKCCRIVILTVSKISSTVILIVFALKKVKSKIASI
jgi:hypothetical protein